MRPINFLASDTACLTSSGVGRASTVIIWLIGVRSNMGFGGVETFNRLNDQLFSK